MQLILSKLGERLTNKSFYNPKVAMSISREGRSHTIRRPSRLEDDTRVMDPDLDCPGRVASCKTVMARSCSVRSVSVSFLMSCPRIVLLLNSSRAALMLPAAGVGLLLRPSSLSRLQKIDHPAVVSKLKKINNYRGKLYIRMLEHTSAICENHRVEVVTSAA